MTPSGYERPDRRNALRHAPLLLQAFGEPSEWTSEASEHPIVGVVTQFIHLLATHDSRAARYCDPQRSGLNGRFYIETIKKRQHGVPRPWGCCRDVISHAISVRCRLFVYFNLECCGPGKKV